MSPSSVTTHDYYTLPVHTTVLLTMQ